MPIHLSYVYSRLNPDLYPGDEFVETLSWYPSFFWPFIARVTTFQIVPYAFFVVHFISLFLFFLAVLILSRDIDPEPRVGLLACGALIIFNFIPWGGAHIIPTQLDHGFFARSLLLFSLFFFLTRRFVISAVILGISFNIHPMISLFMAFIQVVLLPSLSHKERRIWICTIPVMLVLAVPMIVRIASLLTSTHLSAEDRVLWIDLVRLRLWRHLFPLLWSKKIWAVYLVFAVLCAVCLRFVRARRNQEITLLFIAVLILCGAGFATATFYPVPILLKLHLFRSLKFGAIIGFILFSSVFLYQLEKQSQPFRTIIGITCVVLLLFVYITNKQRLAYEVSEDWENLCVWSKENLGIEARVFTPPHKTGFRILALRSPFVEWKDGSALLWDEQWALNTWWTRISSISPELLSTHPHQVINQLEQDFERILTFRVVESDSGFFITSTLYPEMFLLQREGDLSIYKVK